MIAENAFVRAEDLTLRYVDTGRTALEGLRFEIHRGSFVSFVGPSGCGKTTLLKLLAGLLAPSRGVLTVGGSPPRESLKRRGVGFVFQQPVLLPWRTALQNVELTGELLKERDVIARSRECLKFVGLAGFEDAYPRQLSGGMQSRVSLARALVHRPQFLLLDEPFASLDEITRERLNLELSRVWDETKTTTVFVTHGVEDAVFLSDQVFVVSAAPGRVAAHFEVSIPRPRGLDALESPSFASCLSAVRSALRADGPSRNGGCGTQ